jgi:predicted dehydrogenase/aryl-alcohol dehydrogenase-like predicted oxidoreductase
MSDRLAWGILGTGAIAKAFAEGLAQSTTSRLVAVGSRGRESAEAFGAKYNAEKRYANYEELISDKSLQAVYIATPHPFHAEWAIKCADAGKHVLVEKPMGVNHAQAMSIIEAAIANDVFLMEAFMYRVHPQTIRLVELLREKVIGEVRMIQGTFSFHWPKPWNATSRITANEYAGGGILDVGCYPVSMARLVAGIALGRDFADPKEVKGVARLSEAGTDDYAAAVLKFPGDIIAECATGVQLNQENVCRIYGTDGWILLPSPWVPAKTGGTTKILVNRAGEKTPQEITVESPKQIYCNEADYVATHLAKRQASSPGMSWEDSLGNMRTLDQWREQIGLTYEFEKPQNYGRPLAPSRKTTPTMKYGSIAGIDKKVSRLVMGCDNQPNFPHGAAMWDDFFAKGGNTFDTAHIYGGGKYERFLGQWLKLRNVREQSVVICKGAHSPACNPHDLSKQLLQSLERMQLDYADLYLMHRDNPEIPVSEFVDVLNEHKSAGRIRAFGGSNWSLARVQEANDYAKAKGKTGFGAVSNNFSLARMVDAVWAGCIAASDADSRAWFTKTQTPLFAWSSQSRGFFLPGKAAPEKKDDAELVRCWYSEDNFQRLARVNEMAAKRNVLPINIALAYVLNQPFPTFPLIGPRQLSETRTSLAALDIELSPQELRWLNLEE